MTFVEDHLFYEGNDCSGIYAFFRANKELNGTVQKPTEKKMILLHLMVRTGFNGTN
jgi:hypothetical protein